LEMPSECDVGYRIWWNEKEQSVACKMADIKETHGYILHTVDNIRVYKKRRDSCE